MINITQEEIIKEWAYDDLDSPLVSIRCPTYNHEKFITQALDGFLMQKTTFPFEVVVHDDASTDKTADIIREYEKKFPKIIKPIYETENQYSKHDGSIVKIINSALKGKYVAFCEGDDYWIDENKLQLQFEMMEKNPDCTICFCIVKGLENNKYRINIPGSVKFQNSPFVSLKDYCDNEFEKGIYTFQTSCFFIPKKVLTEYSNTDICCFKHFPFGDMPILLFCLCKGKGIYINKKMSIYRILSGGFMSEMKKNPDKRILVDKKLISALNEFDTYTDYEYHQQIEGRIIRAELNIAFLTKNRLLYKKTKKKIGYKKLSLRNRLYYFAKINFYYLYSLYSFLKRR